MHWIVDGRFPDLTRAAEASFPDADWPHWVRYESDIERKLTCPAWHQFPAPIWQMLERMGRYSMEHFTAKVLIPDMGLWGAGMCAIPPGGSLDVHLDADRHPRTWRRRLYTMIVFLNSEWQSEWGGCLQLYNYERAAPIVSIEPQRGRLIVFENTPHAYHGVSAVTGPVMRKSLSLFWYGERVEESERPRAKFVGVAGDHDPRKEQLRKERTC